MKFEIYRDTAGEWRWRLKAVNGQTIATSGEGYVNRTGCEQGIELVQDSSDAPVKYV